MDLLWTTLLNSEWHDWRGSGRCEDRLERADWVAGFLRHWRLADSLSYDVAATESLKALRTLLRRMAEGLIAGAEPTPADLVGLNWILGAAPVVQSVAPTEAGYRLDLQPLRQDWPQVLAAIVADFAHTLTAGEPQRIRICDNPDCRWVFYDDTRNRAKRFCDEKLCGNLMKVRRFRARQRAAKSEGSAG